jgi:Leucine-rich repeat (LRR) protein
MANVEKMAKADVSRQMRERAPALYLGLAAVALMIITGVGVTLFQSGALRFSNPATEAPTVFTGTSTTDGTEEPPVEPEIPIPAYDPAVSPPARTLRFPEDRVAGTLYVSPWNPDIEPNWTKVGDAQGDIEVAAGQLVRLLIIGREPGSDTSYLTGFNHDDLYALDITSGGITDTQLAEMEHLTSLEELRISAAEEVTGEGLGILERFIYLKRLSLMGSNVTSANFAMIGKLTGLQHLDLDRTGIQDSSVSALYGLVNLKTLNLDARTVSDSGLNIVRGRLENCVVTPESSR